MSGFYLHPVHGPHFGDPIGGAESSVISPEEFATLNAEWHPQPAPTPLADLAAAKLVRINEAKNAALDGGFWHAGIMWDSDSKARLAYLELATQIQMDPTFSTPWKASTGSWVTMDATLFAALIPTYRAHVQGCFAWQAAREDEVAAALALMTPVLDAEGVETGEMDEGAARAALGAVSEVFSQ